MKNCTNYKYTVELPDGCQRAYIIGCENCEFYKEPIDAYATKYKECRLCGIEADCTYINQIDGICQSCRSNEEYYEHEHRVSG